MSAVAAMSSRSGPGVRSVVEAMLAASPHRGTRTRLASLGRVVVGISDHPELPDAGLSADGEFAIAFAGTVDNVAELARDAGIREGMDRDRSSADVLLATFRREGEALPGVLRGAYAIVVTDGVTLWTFRDHLGMGTLFYRDDPDRFYAASEAKQVVAGSGVPLEPDLDVLEAIFYSDYDDGTPSALRGVSRLPKAVLLRADPDRTRTRRYWVPERLIETARLRGDELPGRFHALMEQAVVRSFGGADVIALSGGIDSPALAAYAAGAYVERTGEPLSALSAVYPHMPSCDESEYIDVVAKDLGLRSHTFVRDRPTLDG
ncbi:MAG TPA: asparagine synthase-related protein, partial [Actinomycetota bacterium]